MNSQLVYIIAMQRIDEQRRSARRHQAGGSLRRFVTDHFGGAVDSNGSIAQRKESR